MCLLDVYTEPLRTFMAADFYNTHNAMKLTQEQMAELLDISTRSYIDLEHGEKLCQTRVLLLYLRRCKKGRDREAFLAEIDKVIADVEEAQAS